VQTQPANGPRDGKSDEEAIIRQLRASLALPLTREERERSVMRFAREVLAAGPSDP